MYDFLIPHYKLSDPLEYMYTTQGFGENATSFYKTLGLLGHPGLDLRAQIGTYVYASIDGEVEVFTDRGGGRGVKILTDPIIHEGQKWRLEVLNYHLDAQLVQDGSRVTRGQLIARSGNSGKYTTAPHDHFTTRPQVFKNDNWEIDDYNNGYWGNINPVRFLTYEKPMADNLYNLFPHTLIQLTEGLGGFGWWNGEKFYVDDVALLLASWQIANSGDTAGKTIHFTQDAWDAYPEKYNLKGEVL